MFGYVIPAKDPLSVEQQARYKAMYCGVCGALGKEYGLLARLFLSYDFTFLALLLAEEGSGELETCQLRCPAKLGRKVCACAVDKRLTYVADACIILTYWKLQDSIMDDGFLRSLPARLLARLIRKAYGKASARLVEFDIAVSSCLKELHELEQAQESSLDRLADTFARLLQSAAVVIESVPRQRVVSQILYHTGRWIYLIDAWDDMPRDKRQNQFNPVYARFGGQAETQQEYYQETLRYSRQAAANAYQLSDFGADGTLIENILACGMPTVEELVFQRKWKTRRFAHERPL